MKLGELFQSIRKDILLKTEKGEFDAEITGNLRYTANTREDFPAVGDWVTISEHDDNKVLIHSIFPRKTIIERQAIGKTRRETNHSNKY